jgi:HEXXH motif-containing protein
MSSASGSSLAVDFACPGKNRKEHLVRILPGNTQDRIIGFLRRRANHVAVNSSGLVPLLQEFINSRCDLNVSMESPSWINEQCLGDESADHTYAAAVFAASLHPYESQMQWEVRFEKPHRLRFGGLVTPRVISLAVDGSKLSYATADGTRVKTELAPGGEGMREVNRFAVDARRSIILAEESEADVFGVSPPEGFSSSEISTRVSELARAIQITRDFAPEYLDWYGDVVRVIVSLPCPQPDVVISRSIPGQNGVVYVSSPCWGIRLAETLIHEASHQYFLLGLRELRYCNLNDDALYYSPFNKLDRPIERILLAYHAFANVLLFYRSVLIHAENDPLHEFASVASRDIEGRLRTLSKYVERSPGIARAGRLLYQTLADRVRL